MKLINKDQAIDAGLKKYFTGVSCAHGHLSERYILGSGCIKCVTNRMAEKRARKCPEMAATKARHYRKNIEKYTAYNLEYTEKNKTKKSEYDSERYKERKDEVGQYVKAWRKKNPIKLKAQRTNRKAMLRGAEGTHNHEDIIKMRFLQKMKCPYCKESIKENYHVDHILPISKGGGNGPENLQILCPTCNMKKSNKMPDEWANTIGMLL